MPQYDEDTLVYLNMRQSFYDDFSSVFSNALSVTHGSVIAKSIAYPSPHSSLQQNKNPDTNIAAFGISISTQ